LSAGRGKPSHPKPAEPDGEPLLTSNDLFGDLVDAPLPPTRAPAAPRTTPIRIQLSDPAQARPVSRGVRPEAAAEIEDVLSRLDGSSTTPEPPAPDARLERAGEQTDPHMVVDAFLPPESDVDLAAERERASPTVTPPPPTRDPERTVAHPDFGPYRLIERVAFGGMAEVFKAKRSGVEGFEKVVALKRILPHLSDNKEFVDMFVDEAKMVAGLSHPNIVQIYDLGKISHSYYIAMEYVHGRDLRSIDKREREKGLRMPLDLGLHVVSQLCAALEYAHRKKDERGRAMEIVHRDVSPQNILISFEGDVKLVDFGIAKAATKASNTERGALRGKILYMSPEQAWGRPIDRRSDVFSLGIVLYELVTGTKPFVCTGTELTILELVRQCQITPPREINPRVPEALDRVIMKALAREPDERYQDAGQMQRGLARFLRERPPVTARDLARFLELLFDRSEREGGTPGQGSTDGSGERANANSPDPPQRRSGVDH
jgi:serine/threonine protein kinase